MGSTCPRCKSSVPDAANFCASCGQTLRVTAPAPAAYAPPPGPRCFNCGGMYFHFFPNGRATCKAIHGWTYTPYGQVMLLPNPGIF